VSEKTDPRVEYLRRLKEARATIGKMELRADRISRARVATAFGGITLALLSAVSSALSATWILVPLAFFIILVVIHGRLERDLGTIRLVADWYEEGLSRLDHTWQGQGVQRSDLASDDHPYAADLDLFGPGSLFELLCTARTRAGEETLAAWLLEPANIDEIRDRQEAIAELAPRLELREELAVLAGGIRSAVDPSRLRSWAESPPLFGSIAVTAWRLAALLLSAGLITTFILWAAADANPLPFWLFVLAIWGFYSFQGGRIVRVSLALEEPHRELQVLTKVLRRLEEEPVNCGRLVTLREALSADELSASKCIGRLDRLISWLDAGRNVLFAPIAYGLLWHFHLALAIEAWRRRAGSRVGAWLEAVGEFEALSALASYTWEHPDDPRPEIVAEGPLFDGVDIGHPLLPVEQCVANTVALGREVTGWVVSGSNMSGKSTLLRTVGINAVLAFCGAPVRATTLRISPLAIGATIRLEDSLQAGRSRFYAEIRRLKELMDITRGERPLLFLLDEILHGTNSEDRQVGSAAVVRSLIEAGAIGLVTTHDLALSRTADELGDRVINMHFEDTLKDGELLFDYLVKPGVVQRGNALDLMRSIGLDV